MSERQAKINFITVTEYPTYDDAWDAAQAYRKQLKKWCTDNNFSAICVIGVSENDLEFGEMHYGYRGKKEFVKTNIFDFITDEIKRPSMFDVSKKPHLHIVLFSIPGRELREKTANYFRGNGRSVDVSSFFDYNVHTVLRYTMMQSKNEVRIYENVDGLPQLALREFVKSTESINRVMGGNKPVFFGLPLSRELFCADDSVLEENNSEVFAEYCLSQEKLKKLRDEEIQMFEMYGKCKQTSEVFTTTIVDKAHGNTETHVSGVAYEVFTDTITPVCDVKKEKRSNSKVYTDVKDIANWRPEPVYNILYNTPYSPPYNKARIHSPPVPQSVVDGMMCFLESIIPGFNSS